MSLKTFRTELQRTAEEIRAKYDDSLTVMVVDIVSAARPPAVLPCVGYACTYPVAGLHRPFFFPGHAKYAEAMARALFDHAHQVEKGGPCRAAAVLMQQMTAPDDAVMVSQPSGGTSRAEHAARLYDALRAL